jgi:enoyl-CoA hydratase/carnithine racemase
MTTSADTQSATSDVTEEPIRYDVRDGVAYVTLNRPHRLNALNPELLEALATSVDRAADDQDVHAMVFRGSGERAFSAGVDLKHFHENDVMQDVGEHLLFTARLRDIFLKIENCPLPTIAAVHGFALAGGLELALACDFIICTDDCQIGDQHANYDLMAGGGGTQRLPRKVGVANALDLLFTGRRVDGPEALRIGLAVRTCPAADLDSCVEEFVALLRGKSRIGLGLMKDSVHRGMQLPLRDALDLERLIVQEYFSCYGEATAGVVEFNERKSTRG